MKENDIITPASFSVAPELIGRPLARPRRRAGAMAIDLLLLAILLGLVKAPNVLFGAILAMLLLRMTSRAGGGTLLKRSLRLALRGAAAIVLFVVALNLWGAGRGLLEGDSDRPQRSRSDASDSLASGAVSISGTMGLSARDAIGLTADVVALTRASDSASAQRHAERAVARLRESTLTPQQMARLRTELQRDLTGTDSIASRALAAAFARQLPDLPAADSAATEDAARNVEVERLEARVRQLESRLEDEEQQDDGIVRRLRSAADDLGVGFGWAALYFTAFLAMWHGQTPGKKLLGIRVIRLNGKPMSWWIAFERFGGYSASLSTGLLGFAQILWDRNRQALQDKLAETVVVLTRADIDAALDAQPEQVV